MRYLTILLLFSIFSVQLLAQTAPSRSLLPTVQHHQQLYSMSCIPSSVEMVLKFNNKANENFYDFQHGWKNKNTGTFGDFDGKTINGITFTQQFNLNRSADFPIDSLFSTIDAELAADRKVIVSLVSGPGLWHIYVIDSRTAEGDYLCYSRGYGSPEVLEVRNTKRIIREMGGTDILTYRVN